VREGLNDGDRIIVDGVMRVRPGATVHPTPVEANDKNGDAVGQQPTGGSQKQG
jgi:hypothetical protein